MILPSVGIALIVGLAGTMAAWGGQGWIRRRYDKDIAWVRQTALRFRPDPINAEQATLGLYTVELLILILLLYITPNILVGIVFWLIILYLPRLVVEWLWQQRRQMIDQQIPAAVAAMANSLRAGLTLVQAMERLADSAPEPIRTDFRVMVNRYAYGANLEETVNEAKERLQLPNFNLFASALLINRELGGDIAETLLRISQSLDKLQEMRKTVEAHTAEGRTNIKILLVAPLLLLAMMATVDYDGVMLLFRSVQGWGVLTVAGFFIGFGVFFASMITRSEI